VTWGREITPAAGSKARRNTHLSLSFFMGSLFEICWMVKWCFHRLSASLSIPLAPPPLYSRCALRGASTSFCFLLRIFQVLPHTLKSIIRYSLFLYTPIYSLCLFFISESCGPNGLCTGGRPAVLFFYLFNLLLSLPPAPTHSFNTGTKLVHPKSA
jgi:hypothetical protein